MSKNDNLYIYMSFDERLKHLDVLAKQKEREAENRANMLIGTIFLICFVGWLIYYLVKL